MFFIPQMAPANWLILFILFNLIMIFYICNNYYSKMPPIYSLNQNITPKKKLYWMW